ncbi:MAG: hypothetical protein MI807_17630 [Verrucomicrobiales bacterium]|nr:hypothetical protein [Verrucomicrobiales bacterium]
MQKLFVPMLLLIASLPVTTTAQGVAKNARQDPAIRVTLEGAYNGWRQAMVAGNLEKWEKFTAYSRQIETRNRIVSQKAPFPQAMFEDPIQPPSLGGMIALGVYSTGQTATSTYYGKANFGGGAESVRDNLLVLHFLREEGTWKFDNLRVVKLGGNADLLLKIRNADFSFLADMEFQPLAALPPVPQPVNQPEFIAEAWIDSTGYEVTLTVNGHLTGKFSNVKVTELVNGGLKSGVNTIDIQVRRLEEVDGKSPKVEIAIYAAKEPGKPANRMFHFKPDGAVPPATSSSFNVN